jgi:hypothetical protein
MEKTMKTKSPFALLLLAAASMFLSCGNHSDPYVHDGVNWDGDNGGTLELVNGSNKDMVVFVGQTPAKSSILGGVRAGATKKLNIGRHVDDFAVGGYAILHGVTKEEYDKNPDPTKAKIEFNAMVTYRAGTPYRYNIDPSYIGDNMFMITNKGRVGLELRKNSPEGEKVAYLPPLQVNQEVYTQTTDAITLFPVYVYYNKSTQEVTTFKSTDMFESVMAAPRPITDPSVQHITFPNDATDAWEKIVNSLKPPTAYITVLNNVMNQAVYFTNAGAIFLKSQSGFDAVGSGEQLVFEVPSTEKKNKKNLVVKVYNGAIEIPVLFDGQVTPPVIKNGYNYEVSIRGSGTDSKNYTAKITGGEEKDKRDISYLLELN